ncbi:MAG: molybdopterin synthase [Chloroflexi bacterium]|nr:molybdopterin synthase [Chloroflexota bacterium]
MHVRIRLFAQLRELMGSEFLDEEFAESAVTVADLQRRLEESRPALRPHLPSLALAINEEYCIDASTEIGERDEVALIQPISGGEGGTAPFLVTHDPLDRDALREVVRTDASGAVVLFEGVVRNHHEGRAVARLEYEAYASMAERQLETAAREVLAEFADREVHRIAAHHRIGMLEIGEVSLIVAVSASHRGDAFEAALRAVDRIKETVPVWKREHGLDGSVWQEGVSPRPAEAEHPAGA